MMSSTVACSKDEKSNKTSTAPATESNKQVSKNTSKSSTSTKNQTNNSNDTRPANSTLLVDKKLEGTYKLGNDTVTIKNTKNQTHLDFELNGKYNYKGEAMIDRWATEYRAYKPVGKNKFEIDDEIEVTSKPEFEHELSIYINFQKNNKVKITLCKEGNDKKLIDGIFTKK